MKLTKENAKVGMKVTVVDTYGRTDMHNCQIFTYHKAAPDGMYGQARGYFKNVNNQLRLLNLNRFEIYEEKETTSMIKVKRIEIEEERKFKPFKLEIEFNSPAEVQVFQCVLEGSNSNFNPEEWRMFKNIKKELDK